VRETLVRIPDGLTPLRAIIAEPPFDQQVDKSLQVPRCRESMLASKAWINLATSFS
jgi:hypothetical protein